MEEEKRVSCIYASTVAVHRREQGEGVEEGGELAADDGL